MQKEKRVQRIMHKLDQVKKDQTKPDPRWKNHDLIISGLTTLALQVELGA